ncbi:SKP1-like 16 [Arabidopsis thaliana]|uniref:SKP1-like protein 16 n=1 Tax=Arabidopsis thaliana TaxID=3702 RepID=ASK16_ARATH|nr:SKP1-like 16 [Arabidopsis thaliana]O81055.1 RecName: Full=SKP1-like protein 16; Short=AtSK16 [Arabidopsis thaliana]AAC34483.1 E3 ubiquitin ligase SCF complex subunit SKP1/ASK1 (At16), putative [Arabidopsis thaliana]AAT71942.1 At2g03190 [Arabidopsis thaliana]AAU45224.1 At2g03190 [Arabidopsis thaliana]AEC05673.1 SKP1-like 16 [Arabidopsis thaliana]|eukprot:NP_565297.1 SKP1-like 16 [Arabidopsis thaliana]
MSSNKIVLTSSDDESFEVEEAVARKLKVIAHMIDDDCADKAIPLENVTGNILALVIEYCKKHVLDDVDDSDDSTEATSENVNEEAKNELRTWDAEFMKEFDMETVMKLILAVNYLNVQDLLGLTCQTVADHMKDMSPEEVRELFNIENDYTPEEEDAIRKENAWAFEDLK